MPKGGEKVVHAKINIKGDAILFTRQNIIIREAGKERPATPTEEKLARAIARYHSLWRKKIRASGTNSQRPLRKIDVSDYFFALLAACARARDALQARRYDSALATLQAAIENAKQATRSE